jgi:hypothetical protein
MIRYSPWPCTISAPSKACKQQAFSRELDVAMARQQAAALPVAYFLGGAAYCLLI